MVVIASDNSNVGGGLYHNAGIDYLLKENENPSSIFFCRLTAWFRCFLADDAVACNLFRGAPCGICNASGWAVIEGKNIK